jgi:probable HAF family extracellular repeat protein
MRFKSVLAVLTFVVLLFAPSLFAQVYKITDLGPLAPAAINGVGQVAGTVNDRGFMWTRMTGLRDLGTLPGGKFTRSTAINDLGMVAGTADGPVTLTISYWDANGQQTFEVTCDIQQAFVWSRGHGMKGLGIFQVGPPSDYYRGYLQGGCNMGTPISYASGINLRGQVVGTNEWLSETYADGITWTRSSGLAFVPEGNVFQDRVAAINNLGQFVGKTNSGPFFVDGGSHAALWNNGSIADLGTLGGVDPADPNFRSFCSEAIGINDLRQVVGWSTTEPNQSFCLSSPTHAVLWTSSGEIQDLGALPGDPLSVAYKINLFGQVIGSSGTQLNLDPLMHVYRVTGRPFIWSEKNGMQDLNTLIPSNLGWVLNSAADINVWGQIVGSGTFNGELHGFLLTPTKGFSF